MFRTAATALMLLASTMILAAGVFAAPQTLTGIVTDTMCALLQSAKAWEAELI